jgi:fructose-bisphosphate aldolase class II
LGAAFEHGERIGCGNLPVIIAITNNYAHRSQSHYYTHTRQWEIGLRLFLADLEVLTGEDSPYRNLRVMIHLDHIQHDLDAGLLGWDLTRFSSIMFDACTLPFEDNIKKTAAFVREHGDVIVVEGACDEIIDAGGQAKNDLTSAERAEAYCKGTGVDLIVANLGTEHRASAAKLVYRGDLARQISSRIGNKIVLHGASSVPPDVIASLYLDGVRKVNLWTTLERDSSPALLEAMVRNATGVAGGTK